MVLFFLIFFASLVYFAKFFTMIEIDFVKDFYKYRKYKIYSIIESIGNYDTFCDFGYCKRT